MSKTRMQAFGTADRVGYNSEEFYQRKLYGDRPVLEKEQLPEQPIPEHVLDQIFDHSSERMHELPDNSVHLMITSPPYNVGKEYDENLTQREYMELLSNVWSETYRVLVPGGRACVNVANLGRKPYLPLNAMITNQMQELGFLMRGEIIWNKSASAGASCAWGSWKSPANPVLRDVHEYIMVFSKQGYSRKASATPDKTATITRDDFLEFTKSIWNFPTQSAARVGHPAPFPVELPSRLIQLYSYSTDVVLDPFMGAGTTALAAVCSGRHFVGYEISTEYVELAYERIRHGCDLLSNNSISGKETHHHGTCSQAKNQQ